MIDYWRLRICISKIKITDYKDYTGITGQVYEITAQAYEITAQVYEITALLQTPRGYVYFSDWTKRTRPDWRHKIWIGVDQIS